MCMNKLSIFHLVVPLSIGLIIIFSFDICIRSPWTDEKEFHFFNSPVSQLQKWNIKDELYRLIGNRSVENRIKCGRMNHKKNVEKHLIYVCCVRLFDILLPVFIKIK